MLRDPLGWLLYSPRRLLAVAAPAVALAVLAALQLPGSPRGESAEPGKTSASDAASSQPSTSPSMPTERAGSAGEVRRAALRFLDAYVVSPGGRPPRTVPNGMKDRATPALWRGLRLASPAALPRGTVTGVDIEEASATSATVSIDLDDGSTLTLSVVAWTQGWRVSDVRPGDPT